MALSTLEAPSRDSVVVAVGVVVACVLYGFACVISESYGLAFFGIPVVVGAVAGVLGPARPYRASLRAIFLALLLGIVTLREGVVCVLFSLPVLVPATFLGAFVGSVLTRHVRAERQRRAGAALLVLLGMGGQAVEALMDEPARHPRHVAESEIRLDHPAERVFSVLTAPELRVEGRWPWFLRVGLPMPERMRVEVPGPGGRLRFDFSQGSAFARVTRWRVGEELAYEVDDYDIADLPFHITRLGRSPHYGLKTERVQDWLTLESTRYTIERLPGERSRLTRRVIWRRHLFPDLYFGWLEQTVMQRGQDRLLELVRERLDREASRPDDRVYCRGCRPTSHREATPGLFRTRAGRASSRPAIARSSAAR